MSREQLRADIQAAKDRMQSSLGANREIKHLTEYLRSGERVEEMASGFYGQGHGLLVLTNLRVLFVLHGVLTQRSEDFPLDKISSIQWSAGPITGTVTIFASGNKAEISIVEKGAGRAITDKVRARISQRDATSIPAPPAQPDVVDQIRRLGELRDAGVVTDEEFDAKKAELLGRL